MEWKPKTDIGAIRTSESRRARQLCVESIESGHGSIVFVAGSVASGRSTLLYELDLALRYSASQLRVIRGSLSSGEYTPATEVREASRLRELAEGGLGLAGNVLPVLGLLGQVLSVSRSASALLEEHGRAAPDFEFERMFQVLRVAAKEKPIVCLVDDCDQADGRWWSELLLGLAEEIDRDLPLCLVLGVEGGESPGEHRPEEPDAMFAARHLTSRGLGTWLPLPPVTPSDLRLLTGAVDDDVTARLAELSEGRAGFAAELWREWRARNVVERDTDLGPWRFAPGQPDLAVSSIAEVARRRIRAAFGEDPVAAALAWRVLACAALEGRVFTAPVVAKAVGEAPDTVIDLLDDHLVKEAGRPHGLVEEAGWLRIRDSSGDETAFARYRFASRLFRSAFLHYGASSAESARLAGAVAASLEDVYGAASEHFAGRLSSLHALAGDPEVAEEWRQAANRHMTADAVVEQARRLSGFDPSNAPRAESRRACYILLQAASLLWDTGPLDDLLVAAQRAEVVARHLGDSRAEAAALSARGNAEIYVGLPDAARTHLEAARAIHRARHARYEAARATADLGYLESVSGNSDAAVEALDEARSEFEELESPRDEINVRMIATNMRIRSMRPEDLPGLARELYDINSLVDQLGDISAKARVQEQRGIVATHSGHVPQAVDFYLEAIELYGQDENPRAVASALRGLGLAVGKDGQFELAEEVLQASVVQSQAIDNAAGEVEARDGLADVYSATGRLELAIEERRRCLALYRELGRERTRADERVGLAKDLLAVGDTEGARRELEGAAEDARRLGEPTIAEYATEMLRSMG